jgi:hypothetical protein
VTPAVAYVRMSTDHQKYSTENQLDVIRRYATARGLEILRVFEDSLSWRGVRRCCLAASLPATGRSVIGP